MAKAKAFEEHRRWAPRVPANTCPDIDSLIADLEKLRAANSELRELAQFWRDAAEQLGSDVDELTAQVERLERDLEDQRVAA